MASYSRVCAVLLFVLAAWAPAGAEEPPAAPILRIEVGAHTIDHMRIDSDAANRFLVTASYDKTVRVWEIPSGRMLRVLRPPLGPEGEAKINGVAISPDGRTVACAGWTGCSWSSSYWIYLFDRQSGRMTGAIGGIPTAIIQVRYSPDGRYLAAVLHGAEGLRVFRTTDNSLVGEDKSYGAGCYALDFDALGRLVTGAWDGFLRLYDAGFRKVAQVKAPGGKEIYWTSFSPDCERVAVSYGDSPRVDVLSGRDLSLQFTKDSASKFGASEYAGWSADGRYLYAWSGSGLWRWQDGGTGAATHFPQANAPFISLRDGSLVFAPGRNWGIVSATGERTLYLSPPLGYFYGMRDGLLVNHDGSVVQFPFNVARTSLARFLMGERRMLTSPFEHQSPDLAAPRTTAPGLEITDWFDTAHPKLNGRQLEMAERDYIQGLAIAPDGERFVLGHAWGIVRLFDRAGAVQWRTVAPAGVGAVNVAGNGKVVVAAHTDGTLRWYRMSDGKEILALFPPTEGKRWVLWTPSGYYDCSPGGEDLIGWHLNNGRLQAADFYPASRFRSTYYRPDVVARVLQTLDEAQAVRLADAAAGRKPQAATVASLLPPVVRILSPDDGAEVTAAPLLVRCAVKAPADAPVTAIRVLVDGRPAAAARDFRVQGVQKDEVAISVPVPSHDCEIAVVAENRNAASEPATVRVRWRGSAPAVEFVVKPKLYVLAVGISDYRDPELRLQFAAKDAADFSAALSRQQGGLYREVVTRVLTDARATKADVLDGLEWLLRETTSKDVAALFLSGHGANDEHNDYFFLPADFDRERVLRTGVRWSEIKETVERLAGKVLFFVDSCHSGNVMGGRKGFGSDLTALVNELSSAENGAVVFAASSGKQVALEDRAWGNGAFTHAVVEGLAGKADYTGQGKITVNMLDLYISERVKQLTGGRQTPVTAKPQTIPDFPVAVTR